MPSYPNSSIRILVQPGPATFCCTPRYGAQLCRAFRQQRFPRVESVRPFHTNGLAGDDGTSSVPAFARFPSRSSRMADPVQARAKPLAEPWRHYGLRRNRTPAVITDDLQNRQSMESPLAQGMQSTVERDKEMHLVNADFNTFYSSNEKGLTIQTSGDRFEVEKTTKLLGIAMLLERPVIWHVSASVRCGECLTSPRQSFAIFCAGSVRRGGIDRDRWLRTPRAR